MRKPIKVDIPAEAGFQSRQRDWIPAFAGMIIFLAALVWAAPSFLHCDRERFYEGEEVNCFVRIDFVAGVMPEMVHAHWSMLDKVLKNESRALRGANPIFFSLRAPTPIRD